MTFPGLPEYMVDYVYPPIGGIASSNIRCKVTDTVARSVDITEFSGRSCMIRILNENTDYLYIMLSDTAPHAELLDGTAITGTAVCYCIPPQQFIDICTVSGTSNFIGYRTKSGSGYMRYVSSSIGSNGQP